MVIAGGGRTRDMDESEKGAVAQIGAIQRLGMEECKVTSSNALLPNSSARESEPEGGEEEGGQWKLFFC